MTSMGWLTTPTTERTRDMKSSGNQMMATRNRMMRPPMPYLTIFFFFCPLGCGYFWGLGVNTGHPPGPVPAPDSRHRGLRLPCDPTKSSLDYTLKLKP